MNAVTFSQILTDLPDEIVERAAKPSYGKPVLRYSLPAAAAGIVLLIAAAVYPKLRTELPAVTEPPVQTAVTTAAVTSEAAQAVTTGTYTAVTKAQAAGTQTDAAQTAAATVTVYTTALTEQNTATARQTETAAPAAVTETAPPQTVPHTAPATPTTESCDVPASEGTDSSPGIIDESVRPAAETTVQTASLRETVPFWQNIRSVPTSSYMETYLNASFRLCPQDANDRLRFLYGIPDDYDLTQHRCLLVNIDSGYTSAAVLGGEMTPDGFVLKVAFLDQYPNQAGVAGAIPLPDAFTLDPEQCRLESVIVKDETEFREMITKTEPPTIEVYM
ncbi:MAG: hypothetical protein IKG82_11685 [Oscillospiraceae bacterium]|nr:hypothetical protein [Oscillospiraceae bacterium]